MPTQTWKARERALARMFGTQRTPLSGGNSRHTRSDSLHPTIFIETKLRRRHAVLSLYDSVAELAKRENKLPLVVLSEHRRKGFFVVMPLDILGIEAVLRALKAVGTRAG